MTTPIASPSAEPPAPGLPARELAWRVLQAVAAGAYADAALERELARHPLAVADRALATEIAYGAIRQRRLLDAWIDAHGRVPSGRQPPKLRWLLHLGLYQLLFSQRVPAAAAVSTTVELAKQSGLGRLAPVANGLLRSVLRARAAAAAPAEGGHGAPEPAGAPPPPAPGDPWLGLALPADPVAAFAVRRSLPDWLAAALLDWLPLERAEAFAAASNAAPPLDLRVNPLRTGRGDVIRAFAAAGVVAVPLAGTDQGLTLPERPGDLRALPGFREGHWCVQDRSAQRIVPLLDVAPGQRILDACAAPGGKSTQLAEAMADRGEVWALDRSEARLRRVSANAERLGLTAIHTLATDATRLAEERPPWRAPFDRILIDAPCSGLGTLNRHADARWRITPDAIEELAVLQTQLLGALAPLLAPGGRLVYATCTVHPRENGEQVRAFLADHPSWRLLEERQWWPGWTGEPDAAPSPSDPAAAGTGGAEQGIDAAPGDGFYAAALQGP